MSKNNQTKPNSPIGKGPGPGGPGGMPMGEKAKDFKGSFKKLLEYLGRYKYAILVVFSLAIGATVLSVLGPKILGSATTELFNGLMGRLSGNESSMDTAFANIARIMLTLLIVYLVSAGLQFIQGFIMTGISNKITLKMRNDIDDKIHKLPISYYDKTSTGDILSRITNDVDLINQSLNQSVTQLITSITSIIAILVMMISISWQMTLIAVLTLPLSFGIVVNVVKRSQKHFKDQQEYLGKVNGIVEETYSSSTVIKAFNGEEKTLSAFDKENDKLYGAAWKSNFLSGLMMPIMTFIGNLGYVLVCIVGGYMASGSLINVGDIQAFIQYMRQFNQPIAQISQISNVLQQTVAAAERVFSFLSEKEEVTDKENAYEVCNEGETESKTNIKINGDIEFSNVSFGYNPEKIIINNFTSHVESGKKIAIVGPTGAGKTTIVKLLMRFYDVTGGKIMLDGVDIRDFKRDELRTVMGMVLQDTWLYSASIEDNIRYGKLDATREEVINAAKMAQADRFIKTLPDGYNMIIDEEASNISQGQKQLLTIARAVLADPKILILDEATSSVDTRTEQLIQKAMDNLMQGRTSFIIAHRLSTIRNADLILVMKDGDIIEQGNHEELMQKEGFYAGLYNSQFTKTA